MDLVVKRQADVDVTDGLLERIPNFHQALMECHRYAPVADKVVPMELGIDKGQWSRIESGAAHFPPSRIEEFMDRCGNEIPLQWLARRRGYGLVRLQSEVERENEFLREQLRRQEEKLAHFEEFLGCIKR